MEERQSEIKRLSQYLNSEEAEFIAVYGRRRVGKTYLIREFFSNQSCHYFENTGLKNGTLQEQLSLFKTALENTFYKGLTLSPIKSWMDAFQILTTAITNQKDSKKHIIFLDEIPWMATAKSKLIQALDHYWNAQWSKNPNIILIVCGSAASWMLDHFIHAKGGLHNRVTQVLKLEPFTLKQTYYYFQNQHIPYTEKQTTSIYMITGGIPFYLRQINGKLSPTQNIDILCFQKTGLLFEEFPKLFESLFDHADIFEKLIRTLAKKRSGLTLSEIAKKVPEHSIGGRLSKRLTMLEEAGFLSKYTPPNTKKKGSFYRICDEYSLFYLNWIEPEKNNLRVQQMDHFWEIKSQSSSWKSWAGYAFESLCFKHIRPICQAMGLDYLATRIYPWRAISHSPDENGAQIDLIIERSDDITTLCEIKYTQTPYTLTKTDAHALNEKRTIFKQKTGTKNQIEFALITLDPIIETSQSKALIHHNVTIRDWIK